MALWQFWAMLPVNISKLRAIFFMLFLCFKLWNGNRETVSVDFVDSKTIPILFRKQRVPETSNGYLCSLRAFLHKPLDQTKRCDTRTKSAIKTALQTIQRLAYRKPRSAAESIKLLPPSSYTLCLSNDGRTDDFCKL